MVLAFPLNVVTFYGIMLIVCEILCIFADVNE